MALLDIRVMFHDQSYVHMMKAILFEKPHAGDQSELISTRLKKKIKREKRTKSMQHNKVNKKLCWKEKIISGQNISISDKCRCTFGISLRISYLHGDKKFK